MLNLSKINILSGQYKEKSREKIDMKIADEVKARSTLIGLVEPVGITIGMIERHKETIANLKDILGHLKRMEYNELGESVEGMVRMAYNPDGIGGIIYKSGVGISAGAGYIVGAVELAEGIRHKNKFLVGMGLVDLYGASAGALLIAGFPLPSFIVALSGALFKAALVFSNWEHYSTIQRADNIFTLLGAVVSAALRAGIAPVPMLALNAVIGPTQMLYMNNKKFREKVNETVKKVWDFLKSIKNKL